MSPEPLLFSVNTLEDLFNGCFVEDNTAVASSCLEIWNILLSNCSSPSALSSDWVDSNWYILIGRGTILSPTDCFIEVSSFVRITEILSNGDVGSLIFDTTVLILSGLISFDRSAGFACLSVFREFESWNVGVVQRINGVWLLEVGDIEKRFIESKMLDDSWHLIADGTCDLSFGEPPRSDKSLRRQCVENSSVGMNYYTWNVTQLYRIAEELSLYSMKL